MAGYHGRVPRELELRCAPGVNCGFVLWDLRWRWHDAGTAGDDEREASAVRALRNPELQERRLVVPAGATEQLAVCILV
eukprot:COSAG02_NODE_7196_length_3125_cov_1.842697_3_plen_79_part_00